jgi:sugar (pentulose or hexulose) kinase
MKRIPVIAIFDIGKTNKKLFLFDEKYTVVFEETVQLSETIDEDGDPCEDLSLLTEWVKISLEKALLLPGFDIKAINFSAYGASFVHIMEKGNAFLPLYNYLKPYPENISDEFYESYGGQMKIARATASPVAGNLNSGLQIYRIKKQQPLLYQTIRKSLHLPQYLSFLVTNQEYSDMTSIGCHTSLWDFEKNDYHLWVYNEGVHTKLAPVKNGDEVIEVLCNEKKIMAGIGLHDSSAALIPYLVNYTQPFVLISTGTWCISLNPFNNSPLTEHELQNDCLSYIQYLGLPVKASRLFAGYEHELQVQKLSKHFSKPVDYYKQVAYNSNMVINKLRDQLFIDTVQPFGSLSFNSCATYEEAYHLLMQEIITRQITSTNMVLKGTAVKQIFVDGGFSKNAIYMNLLAQAFPEVEVFAARLAQATAIGAALAIHQHWNDHSIPPDLIQLKKYTASM